MTVYSANPAIINASLVEFAEIFLWNDKREKNSEEHSVVLIGGWAVHAYNPWYGSVDIDLVTNSRTRSHLIQHLVKNRDFIKNRIPMSPLSVVKTLPPHGQIIIDFISREHDNRFEGQNDSCPLNLLIKRTVKKEIRSGFFVLVPDRAFLLVLKLKAAWDRAYRIQEQTSHDEEWEKGKLVKDYADLLGLLDPNNRKIDLDIQFLGKMMHTFPFLFDILKKIPKDRNAVSWYGRMDPETADNAINDVIRLIQ